MNDLSGIHPTYWGMGGWMLLWWILLIIIIVGVVSLFVHRANMSRERSALDMLNDGYGSNERNDEGPRYGDGAGRN
jgi:hypothetical protein